MGAADRCYGSPVASTDCSIGFGLDIRASCVRCHSQRDVPDDADLILLDSADSEDGSSVTCVVRASDSCLCCGEHRVKIVADLSGG